MAKLRLTVFAMLVALFGAQAALAQTVANLSILTGNGQLIGGSSSNSYFARLDIKATDSTGAAVADAPIAWTVTNTTGTLQDTSTPTASDGTTHNFLTITYQGTGDVFHDRDVYIVTATAASGAAATFYLTNALRSVTGYSFISMADAAHIGGLDPHDVTLTGQSGARAATPITVSVGSLGSVSYVSNVSVRLVTISSDSTVTNPPTISCVTGSGADPGSVLTDGSGNASCTPVFSGAAGSGKYYVLVGWVDPTVNTLDGGFAKYPNTGGYNFTVTASTPSMIKLVSTQTQSANPGGSVTLTAAVADASGNTLSGQAVNWSVSGSATAAPTSSTSDSNGQVSTTVTLPSTASGTVTVTAALASNTAIKNTFTINVNTVVSSLQKISGDSQSTAVSTAFTLPLVVQVNNSSSQPVSGYSVGFAVTSGSATLSAASVSTAATGQASVTVTAGATVGTIVVTATAGVYTQTFTLTAHAAAPTITASNFYNAADFKVGSISPCSLGSLIATGIAPGVSGTIAPPMFGPLPYQVTLTTGTALSLTFGGSPAPIYSITNTSGLGQVNFQTPCELTAGNATVVLNIGSIAVTTTVNVLAASPGVFNTLMSDAVSRAVLVRPDGSFMSTSNPARRGETVKVYLTGLGAATPTVGTNSFPVSGTDSVAQGTLVIGYRNTSGGGSGLQALSAKLAQNQIGIWEVTFQMPSDAATGSSVGLSVGVLPAGGTTVIYSSDSKMVVQ